jgi:predicted O-methyltransferase YrrM
MTGAAALLLRAVRLIKHPRRACRVVARRAFPIRALLNDSETYHAVSSWTYGRLPHVPVTAAVPGISTADVRLSQFLPRDGNGAPTVFELAILCGLVRHLRARRVLEIGTFDGGTTLNLAQNVQDDDGLVTTVDLPAEWSGATPRPSNAAGPTVVGRKFRGTAFGMKIRQVFGDSTQLDWSNFGGPFDLVFIDGCHEYDYVRRDTANAMHVVRPGGMVLWHDYGVVEDVSRAVDDAGDADGVVLGTSLAFAVRPIGFSPNVKAVKRT